MVVGNWKIVSVVRMGGFVAMTAAVVSLAVGQNRELPGAVGNVPAMSQPAGKAATPVTGANSSKAPERLREGTRLIDVSGTFQSIGGDSVTFSADGQGGVPRARKIWPCSESAQVLDENKGARQWTVSGTITEYRRRQLFADDQGRNSQGDSAASQ